MSRYPHPVFGWDATKLADLTMVALEELRIAVIDDPASANPGHAHGNDIYLYTKAARKRLDALAWAVTYKLAEKKKQELAIDTKW